MRCAFHMVAGCLAIFSNCLSLPAQSASPDRLHTALAQYDQALLDLCLTGRPFERAGAVEALGMSLSPSLHQCLASIKDSDLSDPILLSATLKALHWSGPIKGRQHALDLIAKGLRSPDGIVVMYAKRTLDSSTLKLPIGAIWPPSRAPLVWGDSDRAERLAPRLSGIPECAPWNDPTWAQLHERVQGYLRPPASEKTLLDLPIDVLAEVLEDSDPKTHFTILERLATSGRRDLVEQVLPELLEFKQRPNTIRETVAVLPLETLSLIIQNAPDQWKGGAVAEFSRRGRPLSLSRLQGKEPLPSGIRILAGSISQEILVAVARDEDNWAFLETQIAATASESPDSLSWWRLWSILGLGQQVSTSQSPERERTLLLLEQFAAATPLTINMGKLPPEAIYPRALLGLYADSARRDIQWKRWTESDELFSDLDGMITIASGDDTRALALRRFLRRGKREGWLPREAAAVEKVFTLPEKVGNSPCDRLSGALEPQWGLRALPAAVAEIREKLANSLATQYVDLLDPQLAAGFLQARLPEESLTLLGLTRLLNDRRLPAKWLGSRLFKRVPPGGVLPIIPELAPMGAADAKTLLEAETHAKRSQLLARAEDGDSQHVIGCGTGAPPRIAPSSPPNEFVALYDSGITSDFQKIASSSPRRRAREGAQWSLWLGTRNKAIADSWMSNAVKGAAESRLRALDFLLAAQYQPAAALFPPLLRHPTPAFRYRGLEGVKHFGLESEIAMVFALVADDHPDVAVRAMALLASWQEPGAVDLLLQVARHGDIQRAQGACKALGQFHDRSTVERIATALGQCLKEQGACAPLLGAADAAVFHLGDPFGAGPSSFREPEKSSAKWLEWWEANAKKPLSQWVLDRFSRGLQQSTDEDETVQRRAAYSLSMFRPVESFNSIGRARDLEKARQWLELGPSDDAFALLNGFRSLARGNIDLLYHLDPDRTRSLLVRSMLGSSPSGGISGRDARRALQTMMSAPILSPFEGACETRRKAVDDWYIWLTEEEP